MLGFAQLAFVLIGLPVRGTQHLLLGTQADGFGRLLLRAGQEVGPLPGRNSALQALGAASVKRSVRVHVTELALRVPTLPAAPTGVSHAPRWALLQEVNRRAQLRPALLWAPRSALDSLLPVEPL